MTIIEGNKLTKNYGNIRALSGLSFTIEENAITGLIGRNGAGKTTLLKIAAGFIRNTSGEISVFGKSPFNSLDVSANTFFADDNMMFHPSLNLYQLLQDACRFYPNWNRNLAEGLFQYFRLNPKQYHVNLSKGQKSTFNVIMALCSRCALTIFDEPTTGMDASVRKDFYRALLKDYIQHPRTIIISSHLLSEIEDILENILLLKNGTKVLQIPVEKVKEMAVGLRGDTDSINRLIDGKEIIHTEKMNLGHIFVVVKNDFTEDKLQEARLSGIEVSSVSANDLCIYLTGASEGGIDDVFDRE